MTDRLRLVGAVDAEDRRAEIERAGAHRIAGTARHEAREIGLARDHLRRRAPVRPLGLAADPHQSGPLEAFTSDTDAVAQGAVVALDEVDEPLRRVDDQRAGRLAGPEEHDLPCVGSVADDGLFGRDAPGLVADLERLLRGWPRSCLSRCRDREDTAASASQAAAVQCTARQSILCDSPRSFGKSLSSAIWSSIVRRRSARTRRFHTAGSRPDRRSA